MTPLSKKDLALHMKRFAADKDRGISLRLFCELAGVSLSNFKDAFVLDTIPISEHMQRRVNKAYMQWRGGQVKVMRRPDKTRYVDYRKVAQPPIIQGLGLKVTANGIKVRVGMVNRHDYSESDLNEALRG